MTDTYEIFAIRYAKAARKRSESFVLGDVHDATMPMAYYVWLVRNGARAVVVDTGFDSLVAAERGREFLVCPGETLTALGHPPDSIQTVVLTHLHHDHAGNHDLFPNAKFHVSAAEMAYATGPWMTHRHLRMGYGAADLKTMIDRLFAERVVFHEGPAPVAPGIRTVPMPGHTAGLQAVVVETLRGPVVLASDSAVFYEGLVLGKPFPPAFHIGGELAGYRRLLEIAGSAEAVIPGHDTKVMEIYPEVVAGAAWRVDEAPLRPIEFP